MVDLGNFDVTTGDGLTIVLWYKADTLDTPGSDRRRESGPLVHGQFEPRG